MGTFAIGWWGVNFYAALMDAFPKKCVSSVTGLAGTVGALSSVPGMWFTGYAADHGMYGLAFGVNCVLSLFQPRSDISGFTRLVQSTIIEPALQLAHKMHLSVHEFSLRYTSYHSTKSEERHPLRREWSQFDCVSLSPPGKVQRPPIADVIFTYLFDLSPELVFRAVKADSFAEPRVLKRGRVLVAVTPEEHGPYYPGPCPTERVSDSPWFHG